METCNLGAYDMGTYILRAYTFIGKYCLRTWELGAYCMGTYDMGAYNLEDYNMGA